MIPSCKSDKYYIIFILLYAVTVSYSLASQFRLYEVVLALLAVFPILLSLYSRAPRTTLLGFLVLVICLNPRVDLIANSNYAFLVAISLYASDIILVLAWYHIFLTKILRKPSLVNSSMRVGLLLSLLLCWIAAGIFSTTFAIDKAIASYEIIGMVRILLTFLAGYFLVESKKDLQFVAVLLVMACTIQALLIFAQYAYGGLIFTLPGGVQELDLVAGGTLFRPGGTLGHSSHFAKLAALVIPISFSLFQNSLARLNRLFFGLTTVLIMLALVVVVSRIGIITSVLGIGWILIQSLKTTKGRRILIPSLIVCFIALGSAWFIGGERLAERISNDDSSAESRIPMFLTAAQVIMHNPLGVGLNNYMDVAIKYDDFGIVRSFPFPVHNVYLLYIAEIGIFGGGIFIWLLVTAVKLAFKASREADTDLDAAILKAFGIGISCSWLQGLVGWGHRSSIVHLAYFAILAGSLAAYSNLNSRKNRMPDSRADGFVSPPTGGA